MQYRNCVFTPVVTVWAFLSQVLEPDKSLRNAVSRVITWLTAAGATLPSSDTGAYSKARSRLGEKSFQRLFQKTAEGIEYLVPESDLWCGRRVRTLDGTSVLMSDTAENQEVYPQHSNQREGCGFPIAKLVVMFSLYTGAVLNVMVAAFNTSELVMARELYKLLSPGDVAKRRLCFWHLWRYGIGATSAYLMRFFASSMPAKPTSVEERSWASPTILLLGTNPSNHCSQ